MHGSAALAAPGLLVGATDDAFLWYPNRAVALARDLGLTAFRVELTWAPGRIKMTPADTAEFDRVVADAAGLRVIVTVYGKATSAPTDDEARGEFCAYVRDLLARYPTINDVVIWNEPNLGFYWQPQYKRGGASAAPGAYEALLARCWDVLNGFHPGVNVIMTTSPSGNDNPNAASNVSHSPGSFIRAMGQAYRASGRTRPIFDTVGHNPYGLNSAESPWRQHLTPSHIGEGDVDRLLQALHDGFGGTAQPVPGLCLAAGSSCVSIWYLEAGYQTIPDANHRADYTGAENDAQPVPDRGAADEPTQSTQLKNGILLAYCQSHVNAFFNFLLQDEPNLARWQSGVLWADGSPKASYATLQRVIVQVRSGRVDCAALSASHTTPGEPAGNALVDRLEWSPLTIFSRFNVVWRFAVAVRADSVYRATLQRLGRSRADKALLKVAGRLTREHPRMLQFPKVRLPPGLYRIDVEVTPRGGSHRVVTLRSPSFRVK